MARQLSMGIKASRLVTQTLVHTVLGIGSLAMLFPLYWMVTTSLKTTQQLANWPPNWIPNPISFSGWVEVWHYMPWLRFFGNTMLLVATGILAVLLSCSLVAYGFAFFRFRGRDVLFMVLISTMLLPDVVTLVPVFILFSKLHWVNTFAPLIVPAFFGAPFYIFLLRQFFRTIPGELFDAARIDGCSEVGILSRIVLPLSKAALAVLAVFVFQSRWNDFMGPLIYLHDMKKYTMAMGLYMLTAGPEGGYTFPSLMAGTTVMVLPVIVIFALFQRYFIEGISLTGIKG